MLHWLTIMLLHSVSISYFRRSVILLWCHRLKSNYTCIRQHRITPLTLMYRVTIKFKVTQSETVYMPSFYICCDGHKKSAQIPPLLSTIISLFYSPRFSLALITLTKSWDKRIARRIFTVWIAKHPQMRFQPEAMHNTYGHTIWAKSKYILKNQG